MRLLPRTFYRVSQKSGSRGSCRIINMGQRNEDFTCFLFSPLRYSGVNSSNTFITSCILRAFDRKSFEVENVFTTINIGYKLDMNLLFVKPFDLDLERRLGHY